MLKKISKQILKIILWIIVAFIALDLLIVVLLFVPPIQQFTVLKVSKLLTNLTGGMITVDEIYLSPTLTLTAKNFAIKDHHNNNMIFVSTLKGRINFAKTKKGQVCLSFAQLEEGEVVLRKYTEEEKVNIAIWAQGLKKEKKKEPKFKLLFDNIILNDYRFVVMIDDKRRFPTDNSIDYAFFELKHINLDVDNFLVFGPDISCKINSLTLSQHTGFQISCFSGNFRIYPQGLTVDSLHFTTPNSLFNGNFAFRYNDFPDYADFVNKINFDTKVKSASIDMQDIVYFVPKLKGMDNKFIFSGAIEGHINYLQTKDVYIKYKFQTLITGDFAIKNILDIENSNLDIYFKEANINFPELAQLKLPNGKTLNLPEEAKMLTNARINGNYKGSLTKFNTDLVVKTNLGTLETAITTTTKDNSLFYSGTITCTDFHLGTFVKSHKYLNKVNLKSSLLGEAKHSNNLKDFLSSLSVNAQGKINHFDLCGYALKNIEFIGAYNQKQTNLSLNCKDSLVSFSGNGKLVFSKKVPIINASLTYVKLKLHDFFSHYPHHIDTTSKGFERLVFKIQETPNLIFTIDSITVTASGNRFENLNGYVGIDYAKLTNGIKTSRIDWFRFNAINLPNLPHQYQVRTNAVNVTFKTNYEWKDCIAVIANAASYHVPKVFENRYTPEMTITSVDSLQFIDLDIHFFYTQTLFSLILPKLSISRNTSAHIHIGKTRSEDLLNISISQIGYAGLGKVKNMTINGKMKNKELLELKLNCEALTIIQKESSLTFSDIEINTNSGRGEIWFTTSWRNPANISVNELNHFNGLLFNDTAQYTTLKITGSKLFVRESSWQFTGNNNRISFGNKGHFLFDHCILSSEIGKISVNGEISKYSNKECSIQLDNFDISLLNSLTSKKRMAFGGDMSLLAKIISGNERFIMEGQTFVKRFVFNDESFGDLFLDATILEDNNLYFFGGIMQNNEHFNINFSKNNYSDYLSLPNKTVGLSGKMISKNKELRINAKIDSLKIGFLSPFLSSFSNIISGSASGELDFILVPDSLYFDGKVKISNTQLEIIPLNTVYTITNQEILFDREGIKFNQVEVKDKFKNKATLSGFVNHNKFKDFKIDLNISTPKILALNTPKKIDAPFYGDGFVSGDISIQGDTKQLNFISHNIKTLPGSIITFPLSSANTVSSSKGIYFIESSEKKRFNASETLEKPSTTMNFDFTFDITKDADVRLEIDPIDGVLKCKTSGRLHLTYNSTFNDINLDGTLSIVSGKFNMSLKNFFPRDFTIVEGGTIAFSGPITSAQLNVSALYQKAISLGSLYSELNKIGRTDVMAYLGLTGNLMNPTPTFTFAFPRLTTENQMEVFAALDTANQQNGVRQFFSFVFLNTFISSESNTSQQPLGIGTGIDFVSGILSSFISNQSDNFSIGVNYVDNQNNYKEYSVNAAVNFYNNRLIFKTNLGYAENANNPEQNNSFVGDVNMEYRINDNWRFRAFYFNDKTGTDASKPQQGGGVGMSFQQEFNNRKDFSESWAPKKKDKKNKKK
jgi:hypothetical protein